MLNLIKFVPMPLLEVLARFVSYLIRWSNASIYRSICTNLMLVHPFMNDKERDGLAFITLQNQLISTLDSAKSWVMPPKWSIAQIKTVHHREILERGFANSKGLILVVPHIGTWEMMNAWLCGFGDLMIMYKPSDNPYLNQFILNGRQRLSATLVPTDSTGVKAIFKTLKSGGLTVILPDHVPDKNGGEIVPFFGIPTITGTLTTKLAQKTGCALVGLVCIKGKAGFEVFCYDLTCPNLYNKNDIIATTALNKSMEMMINEHFSHYMWGYRRFKNTPFGDNPYLLPFDDLHAKIKSYKTKNKENP